MDIKAILKSNGIEGEVLDTIAESINAAIPKEFVSKTQYNKKVNAIDTLNETIADLEAKVSTPNTDTSKAELETLKTEFETYKTNIETEKVNGSKSSTLKTLLAKEGVNEKLIPLLLKEFDLGTIELENETVKGWEEVVKPIKDNYSDFFTVQSTEGNPPLTPPGGGTGGSGYTREQIQGMTTEQINANWGEISKSLAN